MTRADLARKTGLLLDANLLVLYVVGRYDPKRIAQNKRTNNYTSEGFDLLVDFMNQFRHLATTPNILTEVSNLLEGVSYEYGPVLSMLPELIKGFVELHEPSHSIMISKNKAFVKFGLSNTVCCRVVEQNYVLLTDDFDLCYYLLNNSFDALNFTNLRSGYLLS